MDPVGRQKKIAGNEYHVGFEKLLGGGGAKGKYQGQRNMSSGTRKADTPKIDKWQGEVSKEKWRKEHEK